MRFRSLKNRVGSIRSATGIATLGALFALVIVSHDTQNGQALAAGGEVSTDNWSPTEPYPESDVVRYIHELKKEKELSQQ